MGANSYNSHRVLSNEEINIIITEKNSLKNAFNHIKNADGIFTVEELRTITCGLIEEYILKRIINICGTREIGMTCSDFLYFYAVLNTPSAQAKLEFILDLIFYDKQKLDKDEYIYNIKKYLFNTGILLKIFLNEEILKTDTNSVKREDIYNFIVSNYSQEIIDYKLFINNENNNIENDIITVSDNQNNVSSETQQQNIAQNKSSRYNNESNIYSENPIIENNEINNIYQNNENETLVINTEMSKNNINLNNKNNNTYASNIDDDKENNKDNKENKDNKDNNKDKKTAPKKQKSSTHNQVIIPKIKIEKTIRNEKIKKAFNKIIKDENGVFPIALFEKMLKEINVIQSLIDVIGNFLRQKSQKTFINFQVFKEILNLIIIPDINLNSIVVEKNNENKNDNDIDIDNKINSIKNESMENMTERSKEEIIDGLFTLFAYPNEFIHKKNFFLFAKSS